MHYHLEVIMPPTDDVEPAISQILAPFDENQESSEDHYVDRRAVFWDWYQIGGRWSGTKLMMSLDEGKLAQFQKELTDRNVTVSSFRMGKPTLHPESQIAMVDELWQETFPECPAKQCVLFDHYEGPDGDVMRLGDIPKDLTCERVIIAQPWSGEEEQELRAGYMISEETWNGVNFQKSEWDGTVHSALNAYLGKLTNRRAQFRDNNTPKPDWLCVTVDYHS